MLVVPAWPPVTTTCPFKRAALEPACLLGNLAGLGKVIEDQVDISCGLLLPW